MALNALLDHIATGAADTQHDSMGSSARTALAQLAESRALEAMFRGLLEAAPDALVVAGVDGRIMLVSAQAERLFGYSRAELIGESIEILVPQRFRAENSTHRDSHFSHVRASSEGPALELVGLRKNGTEFPVEISLSSLETERGAVVSAAIRDITERKKADQHRFRLAAIVDSSDDAIIGKTLEGVITSWNEGAYRIFGYTADEIYDAAGRAAELTRQLLLFSRQQVTETRVMDLRDVLTSMDKMLQRIVGEDVELVLLPPRSEGRVSVNPSHIEQVVLNLVVNARDAMPTGGKLTIELSDVELDDSLSQDQLPAKAGPHVVLAVSDTGTGMDRATQARIFEPFFTTKEMGKGTGLGLSTVFGIVQQSGGSISVSSELGRGTTFKVYLPKAEGDVEAPRAAVRPSSLRGSETILLVEDEDHVRNVVLNALRRQGYHVIPASCAEEALMLVENEANAIDLLLRRGDASHERSGTREAPVAEVSKVEGNTHVGLYE
jgi:PAS domain S-box-containing protein